VRQARRGMRPATQKTKSNARIEPTTEIVFIVVETRAQVRPQRTPAEPFFGRHPVLVQGVGACFLLP
jgi:hypothetical protein